MSRVDISSQRFGNWEVLNYDHSNSKHCYLKCRCECGTVRVVRSDMLRGGQSRSCGRCKKNKIIVGDIFAEVFIGAVSFLIDSEDAELVGQYLWYLDSLGYPATHIQWKNIRIHNFILGSIGVDHKNRSKLDNRKHNLRICTQQQNSYNQRIPLNNTSGYKGVTRKGNKWVSQIMHNRKNIYLGIYESPTDAAKAYDKKATELFGDFSCPNFERG